MYILSGSVDGNDTTMLGLLYKAAYAGGPYEAGYYLQRSGSSLQIASYRGGTGHKNVLQFSGSTANPDRYGGMNVTSLTISDNGSPDPSYFTKGYFNVESAINDISIHASNIVSASILSASGDVYAVGDVYAEGNF